ncbi:MAG: shikimate kinase [Candidatus Poriferisodalaceae bacterium]|jgi:shikimate kinase
MHLVITGLMASGKSSVGRTVAERLHMKWRDSDTDIERLLGRTGADIADSEGVDALHQLESAALLGALADDTPAVIAGAGWVVEDPFCRGAMARRSMVFVLRAPVEILLERASAGAHRRDIDAAEYSMLAERRAPMFADAADLTLDAMLPFDANADIICAHWLAKHKS